MLLAANAFAAEEKSDEQQASEEDAPRRQQADAWALVRAEQERLLRELPPEVFYLWPEHLPALVLFRAVEPQFRRTPEGVPTGLDYWAVRAHPAFRELPRSTRESVLADVATMEPAWIGERARLYVERLKERKAFSDDNHG